MAALYSENPIRVQSAMLHNNIKLSYQPKHIPRLAVSDDVTYLTMVNLKKILIIKTLTKNIIISQFVWFHARQKLRIAFDLIRS